ncbi:Alpha/Beta hydrolase protein [Amanita rubescens]|nr:Alpha/Beta hydrolase protein [Amanita rubescens]
MRFASVWLQLSICLGVTAAGTHKSFQSTQNTGVGLRYVSDSGICETTPGVHQTSGYIDIEPNMHLWFWFFEARNSPETAPFTLWLNGGPGCSSMIGLFQENGPCNVNPDGASTTLNPYSWNNISNVIYIDQPVGTGFSYGQDTVDSTWTAAPQVWQAFQILFESGEFSTYQSREFIFATESYGGHYGPEFVTYFDQQNALIESGAIQGEQINVSGLMINNGWIDPLIQNKAYLDFATYAPGYGQLQPNSTLQQMYNDYYNSGGCRDQQEACYAAGNSSQSDKICANADSYCAFPPEYYVNYLHSSTVKAQIGANTTYQECPNAPYNKFVTTGDDARTLLPQLASLVNSKLKVLIWAGDADIICNWIGNQEAILSMNWYGQQTLQNTPLTNMTINGNAVAQYVNVDNFSFARVFEAGHEVPAFQPAVALEIYRQIVAGEQLHSV